MSKRPQSGPPQRGGPAMGSPRVMVDEPSPRVQAARGLWDAGRRSDAIALFAEAMRQEPDNVRAYVMAARAYSERFDFSRMEEVHEQLVRRAPRHPGVHHYIGETFGLLKMSDQAIASYQRAAQLPGAGPPTWMELASNYERAHRLDEAREMIERTVKSGFDMPLVDLVRARVQRRLKQTADAEASYRKVIERAGDESEWACQAWGELALMKDAQEDYAGAVECIERCKHTQRRHEGRHWTAAQRLHRQVRELIATITRADFARWRTEAEQLLPCRTALLTGFPRSGTTLLEQVLDAHPQLVSSEERDFIGQEFFYASLRGRLDAALLPAINELSIAQIEKDRQRYFQGMEYLLGQPIGPRMHLDKNPAYNLTIPFMLRAFPQTRLIVALRDPRDVILSCYLRYLPLNGVSVCFLDPRRTAERYALDMTAWLKFRDLIETPWRQVRYEDVVSDMPGEARRTLELLDLPWDDAVLNYRDRLTADKRVTSPSYEAVAQPVYTKAVGRWRHYAAALEPALDILEPFVREFGYN